MKIKRNKKTYHSKILSFDVICFFMKRYTIFIHN